MFVYIYINNIFIVVPIEPTVYLESIRLDNKCQNLQGLRQVHLKIPCFFLIGSGCSKSRIG